MKSVHLVLIVAVALGVSGAKAKADTVDPSVGGVAVEAVVPPSSHVVATEGGKSEKERICVSVTYSAFFPGDGETRENFGTMWWSIGIGRFHPERPDAWTFDWDATMLRKKGASKALLIPVTAGVQRGLDTQRDVQPYVAVRLGPYYGEVGDNTKGPDDATIGFNANASAGIIVQRKYVLEARYDWFTPIAGNDFNGITLTAGVKVFDFSL